MGFANAQPSITGMPDIEYPSHRRLADNRLLGNKGNHSPKYAALTFGSFSISFAPSFMLMIPGSIT